MKMICYWLLLGFLLLPIHVSAQKSDTLKPLAPLPQYICNYTDQQIIIDGMPDEKVWQTAPFTERFINMVDGKEMKYMTRAKMLWDDTNLYVSFIIEEEDIRGILTGRDTFVWYDNDIEIFFDPDGNSQDYLEYEMNALNTVYDIHWNKVLWRDSAAVWDIGWNFTGLLNAVQYQGTLNNPQDIDKSWTVELAFPWISFVQYANMPLPPKVGDKWRIDFYRAEYTDRRNKDCTHYSWSVHGKVNMHMPERFGVVTFVKK